MGEPSTPRPIAPLDWWRIARRRKLGSPVILSVANVRKLYGVEIVLDSVSFRIDRREKVALVGRNGAGKTTLLRIITGTEEPDGGSVNLLRGVKIGYLKQENPITSGRTILEEAQSSVEHLLQVRQRLDELTEILEQNPSDEDLEEFTMLHEHLEEHGAYSMERDVETVLKRMGFAPEDFQKKTESLSGGEKTRLALARLLLEEPELLILDEPTNHLDLQATEWLEKWIRQYHGAVLLVSHDRSFLENTADKFVELRDGRATTYQGDFHQYLRLRAEDEARQADLAAKQAAQIAKMDEYVRRFMNSQRTAQARGRQKQMIKLQESQIKAPKKEAGMAAGFGPVQRSGDIVLEAKDLSVGFTDETLFSGLDWTVRFGERWGVIGENGAGKSTLIKTLLGRHRPISGSARIGSRVELGYFSQDVTDLDPEQSPLEHMVFSVGMDAGPARNLLGRFLLTGDDVFRPIGTLSGGEKNKLVLATLTKASPNLLVLDEPTNHLDMDSRDALAEVLSEFRGTLVLISHDRWLLSRTTDHILDVRRAGPIVYPGGFRDYRRGVSERTPTVAIETQPSVPTYSPRELSKEIARMRGVIEEAESDVARLEGEVSRIEHRLAEPPPESEVLALTEAYAAVSQQLAAAMSHWEESTLLLETLQLQQG